MALNKKFKDIQKLYDVFGWNNADTLKNGMAKSPDYMYIAFLTQSGTDAPTAEVLYNDMLVEYDYQMTYESTGIYRIYNPYIHPKSVLVELGYASSSVLGYTFSTAVVKEGYIEITCRTDVAGTLGDDILINIPIKLHIWNDPEYANNGNVPPSPCDSVPPLPPGHIGFLTGDTTGVCNASNVNYYLNTNDANTYSWTLPPNVTFNVNSPTDLNIAILDFGPGFISGTITVTGYYDCEQQSASITVDGAPLAPTVTPTTIEPEASELYTASSTGTTSYDWILTGDVDYQNCTNPPSCSQLFVIWGLNPGTITVTANNSCGTSDPTIIP